MYRTDEERLNLYRKSMALGFGFGDYNEWPIKLNAAFHLFLKEFGEEFLEDLKFLEEEKGLSLKNIAELFYNPSRFYRVIDQVVYSMRRNRLPLTYQRKIALKFLSMAKALKYGSAFNEDGCNIIYNPAVVTDIVDNQLESETLNLEGSKLIHRFCGIMWAYAESIFFRAHDVPKEIHGPYHYNENKQTFIVQEYLNLRPLEIWPDVPLLPCNTIKVFKGYNEKIKIRIDPLNHLYHEGGDLVSNLESYYIEVDGQREQVERLVQLMEIAGQTITRISIMINDMSWHERVQKYADIYWFRKKPLRDARRLCWKVPAHVRKNILAGKENLKRKRRLTDEESSRIAMITI